jgi:HK97 family phage prohead protease
MHQIKACIKSELQEDGGTVKGYASTFDREPDAYGDVIAPGAFTNSLARWESLKESGKFIPLLWGHDTEDPKSNIGRVVEAHEDERGLFIEAEFDADNEKAQYVRKLVQEGRVYQFSFAFDVRESGQTTLPDGSKANELQELELYEVSLVQIPANQHATVEEIKSAEPEAKSGRRNSAKDADELKHVADLANEILTAVNGLLADADDEPDAEPEPTGGVDEREAEKSAEGAKSQAEFVRAYREAIKAIFKED